ncbi:glycosyltransferase family 2 protein [Enterococcus faecium]|uniref:glycosyltransferase family 2 protein n=1 Tax=Enterococcus faecium TaxID=1352 RepID=UPI00296ADD71|nr:glycosyltransferase family 2 protein [Enterococcus faecium]MDW3709241.1 glycosyltransferase family 2 protein [Enterococcus faecium]
MNEPLITIIIPVYNVQQYLPKCLQSVIDQTYTNLEVIVVDDGSTDSSLEICNEFAQKDSRIKVIHKENGGQGSARNCALDVMHGDYIMFLDSDDSLKNDAVKFLYDLLVNNGVEVSACNIELFSETGELLGRRKNGSGYVELTSIEAMYSLWTQGVINIGPWAKLYKASLWESIRFRECFSEDWATMHLIYEKCNKVGYSYDCKLNYLIRQTSSIRAFQSSKLIMMDIAEDNIKFAEKYPVLIPAAKQKAASAYFHLLFQIPDDKEYYKERERLVSLIKKIRWSVLLDKKCIFKTRAALMLSFLGFDFTKTIFTVLKKNNRIL